MAHVLLDSIHFTNDGPKDGILIQSKGIAEEVSNEMLTNKAVVESYTKIYRVWENFNASRYSKTLNSKVLDIHVRRWKILNGFGAQFFGDLCNSKV